MQLNKKCNLLILYFYPEQRLFATAAAAATRWPWTPLKRETLHHSISKHHKNWLKQVSKIATKQTGIRRRRKTSKITAKHMHIRRSKSESKDKPIAPVITFLCVSCNSGSLHITSIELTCGSRPGGKLDTQERNGRT